MKMIEANKVVPLIRLILFGNPNADEICKTAQELVDLHTVDAEPVKHGRWEDGAFENSKKCPICGRYATKIHAHNRPVFDYVVCPYCGAKMDLEGE